MRRSVLAALGLALALSGAGSARADAIPEGWMAKDMKPVGYSSLDGRSGGFKMAIKKAGDRWYLYLSHFWHRGWSIVDVTDPANPKYVRFLEGPDNTQTTQVSLNGDLMVTGLAKMHPNRGGDPNKTSEEGAMFWDIANPAQPKLLSHWRGGGDGTHRNVYPGGKYAYMSAKIPGYRNYILVILDVSDPKNPKMVGKWHQPGQKEDEPQRDEPVAYHGPAMISPDGKMASLPYSPEVVNLDISDIANPKRIGSLRMSPPFITFGIQGVHTVLPIWNRNLLFVAGEQFSENCDTEALNYAAFLDNKNPAKPRLISVFPVPRPPEGLPYKNFCDKGGRFGPHNVNQETHSPDVEQPGNLMYMSYFNAGLRVFDISDARLPTEAGYFIAPTPTKRAGRQPAELETSAEDILVDTRGYAYLTDKQWGLFIVRYTGPVKN
jgi:hypothetical protein